jgi:hypothetical protein
MIDEYCSSSSDLTKCVNNLLFLLRACNFDTFFVEPGLNWKCKHVVCVNVYNTYKFDVS